MCEVCTQKSAESEKKTTCRKCQQVFVYSQFLVDVGSYGLPNVCEECQNLEKMGYHQPTSQMMFTQNGPSTAAMRAMSRGGEQELIPSSFRVVGQL